MIENAIRPIVVAAIRRADGKYLVNIWEDKVKNSRYFRMLGGGIEFGEPMRAALAREFKEEIGAEITIGRQLGAQESLFIFEGKQGHEIVFMFEAEFIDKSFYDMDEIPMIESVFSGQYATWADIGEAAFYGVLGN